SGALTHSRNGPTSSRGRPTLTQRGDTMKNRLSSLRAGWCAGALVAVVTLAATGAAYAQSAAKTAVDAAKKICSGKTITIVWEAGLQSLDPLQFSAPLWEKETGCKVKVLEVR